MHFLQIIISVMSVTSSLRVAGAFEHDNSYEHDHDHSIERGLPDSWYHPRDHPVNSLFRRNNLVWRQDDEEDADEDEDPDADTSEFPEIGTPEWAEGFPADVPDSSQMPQAWVKALDAAVKAGKIPKIPHSTNDPNATPAITYPKGTDPMSPEVCSSSYQCRNPGSLWDAPDGYFGTAFDDGPLPASAKLLDFLASNEEKATHFMIGSNILKNPDLFKVAFEQENDIAVHTYSHRPMTTLSNMDIVAELGWTMQLIHNSTGGRVPRFWRPPYGDSDTRVQAIAHEVFGLRTIIWNQDTDDWNMSTGKKTKEAVTESFDTFIDGPQSPGLVVLEHESTEETVQAFIDAYPKLVAKGWKLLPVTQLFEGLSLYQNVDPNLPDKVNPKDIIHKDTDAGDDLDMPITPAAKTKDNGGTALAAWTSWGAVKSLVLVASAVVFAL